MFCIIARKNKLGRRKMSKEEFLELLKEKLQADTSWSLYTIFDTQWKTKENFDLKEFAEGIREDIRLKSLEYSTPGSDDYEKYWESACRRILEKQGTDILFSILESTNASELTGSEEFESIYELDTKSELKTILAMIVVKKIKQELGVKGSNR
jgi:hypothetical protein